jgi:hypothetical protein
MKVSPSANYRCDCVGELVQVEGCEHWWFEDRRPQCTLLVFIDDATGHLMHLQFVASESTPVQARGKLFAYSMRRESTSQLGANRLRSTATSMGCFVSTRPVRSAAMG